MAKVTRRRVVIIAVPLLVVGGAWVVWPSSLAGRIPGVYELPAWDGQSRLVQRFDGDGTWVQEDYWPGNNTPSRWSLRGRWRVSGSMLILDIKSGSVSLFDDLMYRFRGPSITSTTTCARIVSLDDTRLVISHGPDVNTGQDVIEVLTRRAE